MKKFSLFIFYFLSWIDATLNLLASIFCWYPGFELSISWLVSVESAKVNGVVSSTHGNRTKLDQDAEVKKEEAYKLDGKDV